MATSFGAQDFLTAVGLTDLVSDIEVQGGDDANVKDTAESTDSKGDVMVATQHNERDEVQIRCIVNADGVADISCILGGVGYGASEPKYVLTQVQVNQPNTDMAELTFSLHRHTGATGKTHIARAYTVTLPTLGYGIQTGMPAGVTGLTATAINRYSWTASVTHTDKQTRQGAFLVGHSTKGRIEETIEAVHNGETPAAASGWLIDRKAAPEENTSHKMRSITCHKDLTADAA